MHVGRVRAFKVKAVCYFTYYVAAFNLVTHRDGYVAEQLAGGHIAVFMSYFHNSAVVRIGADRRNGTVENRLHFTTIRRGKVGADMRFPLVFRGVEHKLVLRVSLAYRCLFHG